MLGLGLKLACGLGDPWFGMVSSAGMPALYGVHCCIVLALVHAFAFPGWGSQPQLFEPLRAAGSQLGIFVLLGNNLRSRMCVLLSTKLRHQSGYVRDGIFSDEGINGL